MDDAAKTSRPGDQFLGLEASEVARDSFARGL